VIEAHSSSTFSVENVSSARAANIFRKLSDVVGWPRRTLSRSGAAQPCVARAGNASVDSKAVRRSIRIFALSVRFQMARCASTAANEAAFAPTLRASVFMTMTNASKMKMPANTLAGSYVDEA